MNSIYRHLQYYEKQQKHHSKYQKLFMLKISVCVPQGNLRIYALNCCLYERLNVFPNETQLPMPQLRYEWSCK